MPRRRLRSAALVSTVALTAPLATGLATGCSDSASDSANSTVVVFAASSLTGAFTELASAFEDTHPEFTVTFNFAGSGDLAQQVLDGAPVDVLATADVPSMAKVANASLLEGDAAVAARNTFEILVAHGNPKGITELADLTDPSLTVVLCADTVPCGRGALAVTALAGVTLTPKSYEDKVTGVVTKVTSGEADAGIVYVTDVRAAGDAATGVAIPDDVNVVNDVGIGVLRKAPDAAGARAFLAFVISPAGQAILASYGFLAP